MRAKRVALFGLALAAGLFGISTNLKAAVPTEPPKESAHPPAIVLWPDGAPGSEARKNEPEKMAWREEPENNITFPILFNVHNPSIVPFIPDKTKSTGVAVIIAPGGGHMFLTMDREGYDLGKMLADRGIAAFVLKYRLARDQAGGSTYKTTAEPVADGLRAVRVVRARATEWGVNPNKIGILGFSAGGVPAWGAATRFDEGKADAADPIERQSSRPNFLGMIYAETPRGEFEIPKGVPPTFGVVAFDDPSNRAVPMTNLLLKLKAANVPTEMHVYGIGGHGFGVRNDRPIAVAHWPVRFEEWLGDIGMLK
ncbi:MAG TPA: alpha/beta hydrolase, partial [Tepidisphaeraceae bacterium]|nr:alpha/beta hydrolase [Tepidisphaeraceae bacterium]